VTVGVSLLSNMAFGFLAGVAVDGLCRRVKNRRALPAAE
jgi:hypothetical protein